LKEVKVYLYTCERCEYEWVPRIIEDEPRICPKCKSPYWNKPRRVDAAAKRRAPESLTT
jgi:predicted Zn-ribbon and HTH transcriptional regulator